MFVSGRVPPKKGSFHLKMTMKDRWDLEVSSFHNNYHHNFIEPSSNIHIGNCRNPPKFVRFILFVGGNFP